MNIRVPIILSDRISKLQPPYFYLGGGEVDLKLGIDVSEFINILNPYIADITIDD